MIFFQTSLRSVPFQLFLEGVAVREPRLQHIPREEYSMFSDSRGVHSASATGEHVMPRETIAWCATRYPCRYRTNASSAVNESSSVRIVRNRFLTVAVWLSRLPPTSATSLWIERKIACDTPLVSEEHLRCLRDLTRRSGHLARLSPVAPVPGTCRTGRATPSGNRARRR